MRSQELRPLHPVISPMLQLEPQTPGEVESEESKRARTTHRQVLHRKRGTVFRRNKEARSEIQWSNCVSSAQAQRCTHQPGYASVPQVGPSQAPRPRDQVQKTATVLQRTMGSSLVVRCRKDQSKSHKYAGR